MTSAICCRPSELRDDVFAIDPLVSIAKVPPRRLMVGHGTEDIEIPHSDARDLVAAADGRAELRLDPRRRPSTARRPANGGDVVRLARPAPLRAPRPVPRGYAAPLARGPFDSVRARTTTK